MTALVSRYQNISKRISPRPSLLAPIKSRMILYFIGAKNDGGGGDNMSYKMCQASVKLSPPTSRDGLGKPLPE